MKHVQYRTERKDLRERRVSVYIFGKEGWRELSKHQQTSKVQKTSD